MTNVSCLSAEQLVLNVNQSAMFTNLKLNIHRMCSKTLTMHIVKAKKQLHQLLTMTIVMLTLSQLPRQTLADPALDQSTGDWHAIKRDGDFILGGLFPMHEKGEGRICGPISRDRGMQRAEAMLYAIDRINNDPSILPGLTLGVHMLDTCNRDTFALDKTLEFLRAHMSSINFDSDYRCPDGQKPVSASGVTSRISGVIGASSTQESIMVANILRLFKVR